MNLVTRGLGHNGGLMASSGLGSTVFVAIEDDGSGGGGVFQVTKPKIAIRKTKSIQDTYNNLSRDDEYEENLNAQPVNIRIHDTDFELSTEDYSTVAQAIKEHSALPETIKAIQAEKGVNKRQARSLLRNRVAKEIKALKAARDVNISKDDVIEILIIAGEI